VILPAWTWHSCYTTIVLTGALPVFAEMDESLSIDPADIEKKITPQTKAVMVVHPNGSPANMDRIMALARKRGVKVLEDVAQSCGGQYHGKRLGTIGDIGTYSFQIHKIISAGEGGAVVTSIRHSTNAPSASTTSVSCGRSTRKPWVRRPHSRRFRVS